MKVVRLSKNQYEKLLSLDIPKEVFNTEAKLFRYTTPRKEEKVVKSLFYLEGEIFASKLYTVEMLNNNADYLPESFVIPDSLLSVRDNIVSFTLPYIEGINLVTILKDDKVNNKEKIYYLKRIGELLQQLKNIREYTKLNNIYINDLHASNFIVNPKKRSIYTIDLDSCKIGNNICFASRYLKPFSIASIYPQKYIVNSENNGPGYIIPDENTDTYCYMMMILDLLYGDNISNMPNEMPLPDISINEQKELSYETKMEILFYEYLTYLEKIGVNKELLYIFGNILNPVNNENPMNYLDTLNDALIYRANGMVYKRTKDLIK